ncbi:hypothetical protein DYB28_000010 [Aphanomyces astaci]|uniref:Serine aminopeptidase S33 domain-containing protein n=1 Tax=Aphanomyces astaci TaxID=112090 RepID=A0A397AUV2_APHAT|nr:hypothetical protein DYB36_004408 [Aphanomyces astaci]RHY23651.1 hypothetical protein DYB25_006317 [Aphanomyces astaci]RHY83152.1 hypothetical protein DYB26_011369 [Aphanomyces astaci]RHZ19530.1 hypothetical protein DYB31_006946 [Aphanomyces astaci]RLO07262.1 hypothetical protein DYB28_000010 [Aphanomyces astaci]
MSKGQGSTDDGTPPPRMSSTSPGLWASVKMAYQGLVHTVIRPPRSHYALDDLGPSTCIFAHNLLVGREDFTLRNDKGLAVECSWWKPQHHHRHATTETRMPCIVVLHGNSSSRLGCMETLFHSLAAGIILWGRSMGAVASILCAAEEADDVAGGACITAMVLDSPFSSLKQLAMDLVDDGKLNVPKFAVSIVMRFLRRDIQRRAKFDMFQLTPKAVIHKSVPTYSVVPYIFVLIFFSIFLCRCAVPAFFAIGSQDELVSPSHVQLLHDRHRGPKELLMFPGGHNSVRPPEFFARAVNFCRVMCGLLPMSETTAGGGGGLSPVHVRHPLATDLSVEQVRAMSIKELKAVLHRADIDVATVVEKAELVTLVLKMHARHVRMRVNSDVESRRRTTSPMQRRHSTGTDDPATCPEDIVVGGVQVTATAAPPTS